ncbi:hypothetical protein SESBI_01651 [Sesbania bispinosa]|nr:hypothetical protein SESBI_01651 [Sesbania bispinosa]
MSCISLRLPPARKVWKSFTSTLSKLHKIRKSKAMKKPRKHLKTTTTQATRASTPKFLATTRRFRRKRLTIIKSVINFHKKPAPVYIDKLFKEPLCDLVEHVKPQKAQKSRSEKSENKPYQAGEEAVAGTSRGGGSYKLCTSDDMWESLALASPQMQGIDERAEEFITRFREEMVAQEILARNL